MYENEKNNKQQTGKNLDQQRDDSRKIIREKPRGKTKRSGREQQQNSIDNPINS